MDTKVSNQSVPVEQVSNAEDVHNVATTMQPEEVAATEGSYTGAFLREKLGV